MLVGVKAEIGRPSLDRPDEGRIEFFLDWYVSLLSHQLCLLIIRQDYAFRSSVGSLHYFWTGL